MQGAISRTMTAEATVKYVEVIVRRHLQESGEFDEPSSIITHWKKKKGKNSTDILFTALPTRLYYQYLDRIRQHEDSVLLYPLYSVLFGVLKRMRPHEPTAVVFQHNRFADLIIGTNDRIHYANRCVGFDTSKEQISALWDTVRTDIKTVASENRIKVAKVVLVTWIDSGAQPDWPEEMESELFSLEEEAVSYDGETHNISFLKAIRMQSGGRSISPPSEKTFYYARRCLPFLNMGVFLSVLLLIGGYFWCTHKAGVLQREMKGLERNISSFQVKTPAADSQIHYQDTLALIKDLAYYKNAPSYKEVVNDISDALSADVTLEVLKMDYSPGEMRVEMFGQIKTPFDTAYKGYQRFLDILGRQGYAVQESRFDTEISVSQFLLKLVKSIP
jgi:hypothetical protein